MTFSTYFFRENGKCRVGARTATCCSHCAAILYVLGIISWAPAIFKSRHLRYHYFDKANPDAMNRDLVAGLLN